MAIIIPEEKKEEVKELLEKIREGQLVLLEILLYNTELSSLDKTMKNS